MGQQTIHANTYESLGDASLRLSMTDVIMAIQKKHATRTDAIMPTEKKHITHSEAASVEQTENDTGLDRIVFFSDAVFAIAITLLALEIKVPEIEASRVAEELPAAVWAIIPQFLIFAQTFLIIATCWVAHHRMFQNIKRYDFLLIWINVFYLLGIAFMPVPSALVIRYLDQPAAILFYSIAFFITTVLGNSVWWYASHNHRLIDSTLDADAIRYISARGAVSVSISVIAIAVSFINPRIAFGVWTIFFLVSIPFGRLYYIIVASITNRRVRRGKA